MGITERKKRERDRRRQQIMIAARRVFCDHGYSYSTISSIAKEAEISPGTIYLYFRNKEDLFLSLTLQVFYYLNMRLAHFKDYKHRWSWEKRMSAVCDALIDSYEHDPKMMRFTLQLQGSEVFSKLSENLMVQLKTQYRKTIDAIVEFIVEDTPNVGVILEPITIAKLIWSQFTGIVLVNESLNTINQAQNVTLHEELKLWITTFLWAAHKQS